MTSSGARTFAHAQTLLLLLLLALFATCGHGGGRREGGSGVKEGTEKGGVDGRSFENRSFMRDEKSVAKEEEEEEEEDASRGRAGRSGERLNLSHDRIFEYCENEDFVAKCGADQAVLITHGLYGRMSVGKCLQSYDVGCSKDVRERLEKQCAGRSSCKMPVSSLINHHPPACSMDLRSYLEASYTCVLGECCERCLQGAC